MHDQNIDCFSSFFSLFVLLEKRFDGNGHGGGKQQRKTSIKKQEVDKKKKKKQNQIKNNIKQFTLETINF